MAANLSEIRIGDTVVRWLGGGGIHMLLEVESITEKRIICVGGWEFDRATGMEIDEQLGWGPEGETGSWIEAHDELNKGFDE